MMRSASRGPSRSMFSRSVPIACRARPSPAFSASGVPYRRWRVGSPLRSRLASSMSSWTRKALWRSSMRHRGGQGIVERATEGLAGRQAQARAQSLPAPGRVVAHRRGEVGLVRHGGEAPAQVLGDEGAVARQTGRRLQPPSVTNRSVVGTTRTRSGNTTSGRPSTRSCPWYVPGDASSPTATVTRISRLWSGSRRSIRVRAARHRRDRE